MGNVFMFFHSYISVLGAARKGITSYTSRVLSGERLQTCVKVFLQPQEPCLWGYSQHISLSFCLENFSTKQICSWKQEILRFMNSGEKLFCWKILAQAAVYSLQRCAVESAGWALPVLITFGSDFWLGSLVIQALLF